MRQYTITLSIDVDADDIDVAIGALKDALGRIDRDPVRVIDVNVEDWDES